MALIQCYECKKEISDQAPACPNCGAPIAKNGKQSTPSPTKAKTHPFTWFVLVVIVALVVTCTQSQGFKEEHLPPLPVTVGVRDAVLATGKVLQVKNTSANTLMVVVTLSNSTTQQRRSYRLDIPADGVSEIGHLEGWTVASGDQIEIRNDAYKTWNGNAP